MNEMKELMEQFNANFENAVKRQEQLFERATQEFNALTSAATEQYQAMIDQGSPEQGKVEDPPAAAWIKSPVDGEEMLVLNKPAVTLFLSIFEQMGSIVESEGK